MIFGKLRSPESEIASSSLLPWMDGWIMDRKIRYQRWMQNGSIRSLIALKGDGTDWLEISDCDQDWSNLVLDRCSCYV